MATLVSIEGVTLILRDRTVVLGAVAIAVEMRSHQRRPRSPRVRWVTSRSNITKRIACSPKLFVGSIPGVEDARSTPDTGIAGQPTWDFRTATWYEPLARGMG